MTALVLVEVSGTVAAERCGIRLDIFPGGVTPAVFPAGTPFWVGYGFAPDAALAPSAGSLDDDGIRFELDVDRRSVDMRTDLTRVDDALVRKTVIAEFPAGLPAGWHELAGRWYDRGKLILTSRADVEFVER